MVMLGLNIFTDTKNRMKQFLFLVLILCLTELSAQITVEADITSGCNPSLISFNIQPESARDTITTIEWNFGNWTATRSELSPSVLFDVAGSFDVSCVINGVNAINELDFISITECSDTLNLPNVFSPNEDNVNDIFTVKTNGITSYSFSVYARSGNLIYKTESPAIIWDGRSLSGQKMKNGIYFYIIRQLDGEPLNEFKGIVYLFE